MFLWKNCTQINILNFRNTNNFKKIFKYYSKIFFEQIHYT